MENFIDEAKKYMSSDEGKNLESQAQGILDNNTGEGIDESTYKPPSGGSSGANAFPTSSPSYGSSDPNTSNQYTTQNKNLNDDSDSSSGGGVSGGEGGGLGVGAGIGGSGGRQRRESQYEGYEGAGDSATSGGYGANERGDAFSRENQMGTDAQPPAQPQSHSQFHGRTNSGDDYNDRYKSGTSTPGYLGEGEGEGNDDYEGAGKKTQGGGGSAGLDPYGDNEADDTSNNPYHERRN